MHPIVWVLALATIVMAVALPFARREDWLGWLAFGTILADAVLLYGLLLYGLGRSILAWFRDKPRPRGDSEACVCYEGHLYRIAWDRERFALQTSDGGGVLEVPLEDVFQLLDADSLFIKGEVTVDTPTRHVEFPSSRSARAQLRELVRELTRSSPRFREDLARRRGRYLRLGLTWLPLSVLLGLAFVLSMRYVPEPKPVPIWLLPVGLAIGGFWYWLMWRFAYGIACLGTACELGWILRRK